MFSNHCPPKERRVATQPLQPPTAQLKADEEVPMSHCKISGNPQNQILGLGSWLKDPLACQSLKSQPEAFSWRIRSHFRQETPLTANSVRDKSSGNKSGEPQRGHLPNPRVWCTHWSIPSRDCSILFKDTREFCQLFHSGLGFWVLVLFHAFLTLFCLHFNWCHLSFEVASIISCNHKKENKRSR